MDRIPTHCQRCRKKDIALIGSMFDTTMICLDCKAKEEKHPDYEKARDADVAACRGGNYNFHGIGRPSDL